jgi:uracil-DNA glycosylase
MVARGGNGWVQLYREINTCTNCGLRSGGGKIVLGRGSRNAPLMVVGEAPGAQEESAGQPFVGRSGRYLIRTLQRRGVNPSRVYFTNVLKYRPPGDREPRLSEARACSRHLFREIELVQPRIVCALGGLAARTVLGVRSRLAAIRGKYVQLGGVRVLPTFHPSYVRWSLRARAAFERDLWRACSDAGLSKRVPQRRLRNRLVPR